MAASREMLQDAAFELFLENGYAGTTVDQIAQRAGVSRNTFFNYFGAKGDVFWVELDEAVEQLCALLAEAPRSPSAVNNAATNNAAANNADASSSIAAVHEALMAVAAGFGPARVPFVLTQAELLGSTGELQASVLGRITRPARSIREFLTERGVGPLVAQTQAFALLGAAVAAAQAWAAAGTTRGPLTEYLSEALAALTS